MVTDAHFVVRVLRCECWTASCSYNG